MPQFGQENPGVGVIPYSTPQEAQAIVDQHRNRERNRMLIPEEPEPIVELSKEQRVYIYNVGPCRFQQDLASYGSRTIPGLPKEQVFKGLTVAGPLVIEGIPSECYPAEGEAKRIYHRPLRNRGRQSARPGYDFALEVVGRGMMVNPSCDLIPFGVFISEQLEREQPEKGSTREQWAAFHKWKADVEGAQKALRAKCSKVCQEANIEHSRGKFAEVRNDQLYVFAELINGTELQYPWLKDSGDKADRKKCWSCGTLLEGFALKCGGCGEMQVTQEEFDAEKARRAKGNM